MPLTLVLRVSALAIVVLLLDARADAYAAPVISQGTYTESTTNSCPNSYSCTASFTAVPTGKTLIVRNISCYVFHTQSVPPTAFRLVTGQSTVWIPLGPYSVLSNNRRYFVNVDVFAPIGGGLIPRAWLSLSNTASGSAVTCTIAGELRP